MPLPPLNDRLRFVTATGQIDHAAIDADTPRRAAEMRRRSPVARGFCEWMELAESDLQTYADGELQLWEMRKLARDQGLQSVSDILAPVSVGAFNDNQDDYDAKILSVRIAMAAE